MQNEKWICRPKREEEYLPDAVLLGASCSDHVSAVDTRLLLTDNINVTLQCLKLAQTGHTGRKPEVEYLPVDSEYNWTPLHWVLRMENFEVTALKRELREDEEGSWNRLRFSSRTKQGLDFEFGGLRLTSTLNHAIL